MFKEYINKQKQNIIGSVCDLITYPSISVETNNLNFPFGKDCSDALKYFLHLASSLGFRTKNVDGYCGFAEFGEGEKLIGIIGHLDVVPAESEDWTYSCFTPTIVKNRIYGRGAIDDKGPVVACLYAMKAVMDFYNENNIKFNKRVRLIVGLNEEKDWKCIEYYKKHEEIPNISFSPDADFPCIYAEKSVLSVLLCDEINIIDNSSSNKVFGKSIYNRNNYIKIQEIDYRNNAINVVPEFVSIVLNFGFSFNIQNIINFLKQRIDFYNYDIDLYKIDNHNLKITSYGVAAHSAHPNLGKNAITKLLVILNDLFIQYKISYPLINKFCEHIGDDYTGSKLGLNIQDESGNLTVNTAQFYIKDNKICIGINLRIPVNTPIEFVVNKFESYFSKNCVLVTNKKDKLFIPKENKLVQKLCTIFNETCNTDFKPLAIGGATYARAFPNCISFGMNFPGDKDMCHQKDEYVEIDKLILSTNIYARAIHSLLQED